MKAGGTINPKYLGGPETQRKLLENEGHKVARKGKEYVVVGYEKASVKL